MRSLDLLTACLLAGCAVQPPAAPPEPAIAPTPAPPQTAPIQDPHPWSAKLATAVEATVSRDPREALGKGTSVDILTRVINAPRIGSWFIEDHDEPDEIGPHGIGTIDWAYIESGLAPSLAEGLKSGPGIDATAALRARAEGKPLTLEQWAILAPRLALVRVVRSGRVDRGDGLAHEIELAVEEAWRGPGGTMLLRLPEISDPAKQAAYMPPVGSQVLIAASRTAYLARPLLDGLPPSIDERVVHALLPPLPVVDGMLRIPPGMSAFPGMPAVEGMTIESMRSRSAAIAPVVERARPPAYETLAVLSVDGRPIEDPLYLYFTIAPDPRTGRMRPVRGYDGCNWFSLSRSSDGHEGYMSTERGCFDPTGKEVEIPGYMDVIIGKEPPQFLGLDQPDRYAPIVVRANGHQLIARRYLR